MEIDHTVEMCSADRKQDLVEIVLFRNLTHNGVAWNALGVGTMIILTL